MEYELERCGERVETKEAYLARGLGDFLQGVKVRLRYLQSISVLSI